MKISIVDIKGSAQGEVEVAFPIIEDEKGEQAVHDTVVAYSAAQRSGTACAKTRGEVAASKKKPWRQKGTGRARAGSTASPIWVGGGVAHGPRPRDFTKKVNKPTRRLALRKALSERLKAGDVVVVDDFRMESSRTKEFLAVLDAIKVYGSILVVTERNENLTLASRNVQDVELITGGDLNTYQVLKPDKLVFTRSALEAVGQRLTKN